MEPALTMAMRKEVSTPVDFTAHLRSLDTSEMYLFADSLPATMNCLSCSTVWSTKVASSLSWTRIRMWLVRPTTRSSFTSRPSQWRQELLTVCSTKICWEWSRTVWTSSISSIWSSNLRETPPLPVSTYWCLTTIISWTSMKMRGFRWSPLNMQRVLQTKNLT